MAKTTLGNIEEENSNDAPFETDAEVVETQGGEGGALIEQSGGGELSQINNDLGDAGLVGDFNQGDINLPRLNVVAKTSQLVDDGFAPGAIVLNKEVTLALKDTPLSVVVLSMTKQLQEDVPWGEDRAPRVFQSEAEANAAGFSTEWGSTNLVRPMAHITMLVEAPDGLSEEEQELFPYEFEDKQYAMAVLTASKSAYKTTAKEIATYAAFAQGAGVWTTGWNLTSKLRTEGDVSWFSPQLKRSGRIKEELLAFVEGVK